MQSLQSLQCFLLAGSHYTCQALSVVTEGAYLITCMLPFQTYVVSSEFQAWQLLHVTQGSLQALQSSLVILMRPSA